MNISTQAPRTTSPFRLGLLFLAICGCHCPAATSPGSLAYILQADAFAKKRSIAVERLAECGRDWLVLDPEFTKGERWSNSDLDTIHRNRTGRKILAYLSIGEAEDYRPYWRKEWGRHGKLSSTRPGWILEENPEWKGNYRVRYWQGDWQRLALESVDAAMTQGFDGVYLDIVDAFEVFEKQGSEFIDDRQNPDTKQSYRRDMVDWVKAIALRARSQKGDALVVPQNGSQLLAHPDFAAVVSGIGLEDTFTDGNKLQPRQHTDYVLGFLKPLHDAGKPVLAIEYPKTEARQATVRADAKRAGMIWLVADRQLKTLGESGN